MKVTDVKRNTCLLYNLTKCTACLQRVACTNHIFVRYKSHYDVLGLPRNASQKDIRDAYIKLSKKLHPDQNQEDKSSHQKFVKVQEAYEILSKEASRNHYDSLHNRRDQPIKSYPANRSSQRPPHYYSSGQNFTDNNYYSDPRSQQSRQGDPFSFYGYEQNQRQSAEEEYETPVTSWREKYNFTIESVFKYSFCVLMVMFAVLLGFLAQEYYIGYNLQAEIEDIKKEIERKAEMKKKKESSSEVTQFKDS